VMGVINVVLEGVVGAVSGSKDRRDVQ
jgi:hypothetical protein